MKNPKLIVKPFAKNGQKNVIPENYETSMESNQATWDQGFGLITMLPVAAGGLPPKGQDFNGIFNQLSENIVYLSQGGRFKFSAEYAEAIGGYPKGAILQSDDEKKEYLSLIDNNKVNFNTATDISTSWKLVNTDDLLAQIASKQPKGDYATKTDVGLKLDKTAVVQSTGTSTANVMSQKSVTDELNKKFDKTGGTISGPVEIKAAGRALKMTAPNSDSATYLEFFGGDTSVAFLGFGQDGTNNLTFANRKTDVTLRVGTNVSVNGVPVLLETDKTPVGMFGKFPHRAAQLPDKWYSVNGDRYSVSSPQGLALKSLPAQLKSDWGIVESGGMINVPNIKQSDGRTPFLRPVNGTSQQVGAVVGDQMRNLTGGVYFRQRQAESSGSSSILWNMGAENEALTTREYNTTAGPVGLAGTGLQKTNTVELNARNQVPTGPEFKPLDIGVTLAIYLGV